MSSKRLTNLYHCTKSDSLLKILGSKCFKYSYCLEEFYMPYANRYVVENFAYAMVCFADFLDEEVSEHMEQFSADSYIVMDKIWAIDNGLSPVIYYNKKSLPHGSLLFLTKSIGRLVENGITGAREMRNALELLRPYYKLYKGHYFIKGSNKKSNDPVEFFLEREWRSIAAVTGGEHYFLGEKDYLNEDIRNKASQELLDHKYCLRFEWDDIKQIGCKEGEKNVILHTIHESFGVDEDEAESKIVLLA